MNVFKFLTTYKYTNKIGSNDVVYYKGKERCVKNFETFDYYDLGESIEIVFEDETRSMLSYWQLCEKHRNRNAKYKKYWYWVKRR